MELYIECLSHHFKSQQALKNVTLAITSSKITGLVGPDGAGKTTLMRMIAGLLKPSAGVININGMNPIDDIEILRPQIGYMPQRFGLYEDLTVLENLTLYADLNGILGDIRKKRFEVLLNFTDLARFSDRFAGKLSGGMKQKLGLACVLIGSPTLLLLDEPSVGVDPISRQELWQMVTTLALEGMTIIWSTAYLDEAERCHEVVLMNEGAVLYEGTPESLYERMRGRCYLIQKSSQKRKVLQESLRADEIIDGVIQGYDVRIVLKEAHVLPVIKSEPVVFIETSPRLEDAFIDLLGGALKGDSILAEYVKQSASYTAMDSALTTVIEAKNLTKTFGTFIATDQVNFSVKKGEIFGLLGPNGAGKSTTFKMMCGLLTPTKGDAHVMGIDLKKSASLARQKLGYMSQKFALYGQLSVQQNLMFFAGIYGLSGKNRLNHVQKMVEIFALMPFINTDANDLALGYKQRLALACAMMHAPQILFLDEPTSGVDPLTRREFWSHINGIVEQGITIMVTTHFMDEAEYCDRIGLVYRGKLIACDTPDALKQMVTTEALKNPSMEDAFIQLVRQHDAL